MHGLKCKLVFLLLPLTLMACATRGEPGIKVEYVDRPVIQEVPCVKAKDVPTRPAPLKDTALPSNVEAALSVALARISQWTRYGNKADAILTSCAK